MRSQVQILSPRPLLRKVIITKTILYIVRHGQSTSNEKMILSGGNDDAALTEKGIQQAHETKKKLEHVNFDTAYSSDLKRAAHTGSIIYGDQIPATNQLRALRERSFGSVEREHQDTMNESHKKIASLSPEEKWHYKHYPGVESDHSVSVRYIEALDKIARKEQGKTILVGAHGSAIRTTLIGLDRESYQHVGPGTFKNGGYIVLEHDGDSLSIIEVEGVEESK